jgi:hypothetical protein
MSEQEKARSRSCGIRLVTVEGKHNNSHPVLYAEETKKARGKIR